jgi:hypothetical protein
VSRLDDHAALLRVIEQLYQQEIPIISEEH